MRFFAEHTGGAAAAQLLAPVQDDIDLRGLSSFTALLVDEETLSVGACIKTV